jgi:hypothetical protein
MAPVLAHLGPLAGRALALSVDIPGAQWRWPCLCRAAQNAFGQHWQSRRHISPSLCDVTELAA